MISGVFGGVRGHLCTRGGDRRYVRMPGGVLKYGGCSGEVECIGWGPYRHIGSVGARWIVIG